MSVASEALTPESTQPLVGPGQIKGLARDLGDLTALTPRLIAYNIAYAALVWGLALGALTLFWAQPAWYTFLLAFLLVASRQQALLNIEHECTHGKFVRGRRLNNLLGRYAFAAPVGSPYAAATHRHLTHHRLLGSVEDPDHDLHAGENLKSRAGLAKHFAGGLLGGYAGMVLMGPPAKPSFSNPKSGARQDLFSLVLAQGILFATIALLTAWWVYPALWVAPLVTVTVLSHLIRTFAEHAITPGEETGHDNRLITISSNAVERFMVAPYSMNLHAEHHIMPSVPAPRLQALQRRLSARNDLPPLLERSSYATALKRYAGSLDR